MANSSNAIKFEYVFLSYYFKFRLQNYKKKTKKPRRKSEITLKDVPRVSISDK